jgi:hypothetical protein
MAAEDEVQDQQRQASAEVRPGPEEAQEVDRPHVRDAGLVEPGGEEEDPQGDKEDDEAQVGPEGLFLAGAVHGGVSLADVTSPGTKPTEAPTSPPVPPPP